MSEIPKTKSPKLQKMILGRIQFYFFVQNTFININNYLLIRKKHPCNYVDFISFSSPKASVTTMHLPLVDFFTY